MSEAGFALDPRLAADTCPVASLPLCDVLLMNDEQKGKSAADSTYGDPTQQQH